MNQLARLQQQFQRQVLQPQSHPDCGWISATGRADPEQQLSVYSYAYGARLKEALLNDFPALLPALGDDAFNRLAEDYIQAYPSRYTSLRDFGRDLPKFIKQHEFHSQMPWLYELAVFEWQLCQAFDAADASLFSEQDMAGIPPDAWPELRFVLHPSLRMFRCEWNTVSLWQALTADPPEPVTAELESNNWIIWREQLVTRFRSLSQQEQLALEKVHDGGSFDEVCEVLADHMDEQEVPLFAAGLLKNWIAQGLICGIEKS